MFNIILMSSMELTIGIICCRKNCYLIFVNIQTISHFQQDGAPAHRDRETVELLKMETPNFIPPNLWPPNSPDLNPVDYKIWGIMQDEVYRAKIRDIEELRQRIVHAWEEFDQLVIDAAILANGVHAFRLVLKPKADILNT